MSEDEACRRIDLARLARKFPALFAELESGRITLSVALVLKPVLSQSNHLELLAAARGKCIRQARELVAEHFPKADVPSIIRKLPERRPLQPSAPGKASAPDPSSAASVPPPTEAAITVAGPAPRADLPAACPSILAPPVLAALALHPPAPTPPLRMPTLTEPSQGCAEFTHSSPRAEAQQPSAAPHSGSAPPVSRCVIEPLSAQRYRIQFTADAVLKRQLEQARDLLRHAHPSGDFGPIVSRALQLLIDDLMRRRFGARARRGSPGAAAETSASTPFSASATHVNASPSASASEAYANASPSASEAHANARPSPSASKACANARPSPSEAKANPSPSPSEPNANFSGLTSGVDAHASLSEETGAASISERASPACPSPRVPLTAPGSRSPYVPRAARRTVLQRDALGCSWTDANGVRCGSQAWLEIDHRQPAGKGGPSEPDNLRLLCRAHNQLAAEHAYGRKHIERARARRRETLPSPRQRAAGHAGRRAH
jgi:hypothetical protein